MAFEISKEMRWVMYIVIVVAALLIGWYVGGKYGEDKNTTGAIIGAIIGILIAGALYYMYDKKEEYGKLNMIY